MLGGVEILIVLVLSIGACLIPLATLVIAVLIYQKLQRIEQALKPNQDQSTS